ncbi:MAG: hypothetical protein KDJ75_05510 [Alphaproteobacteria bacterium]|nr:hypothetical protein [Alphaproteobacteria bacterium]
MKAPLKTLVALLAAANIQNAGALPYPSVQNIPLNDMSFQSEPPVNIQTVNPVCQILLLEAAQALGERDTDLERTLLTMFEEGSELYRIGERLLSGKLNQEAEHQHIEKLLALAAEHPAMQALNSVDRIYAFAVSASNILPTVDERRQLEHFFEAHQEMFNESLSNLWMTAAFAGNMDNAFAAGEIMRIRQAIGAGYQALGYSLDPVEGFRPEP